MLTKKQLEDAIKCDATCQNCSLIRIGEYKSDCIPEIAQTTFAYREMLERHIIEEGHYSSLEELAEVEELLKESEVEEGWLKRYWSWRCLRIAGIVHCRQYLLKRR